MSFHKAFKVNIVTLIAIGLLIVFFLRFGALFTLFVTYNEYQNSLDKYGNNLRKHKLETQMRCEGGDTYLKYIKEIMCATRKRFEKIENYDF